ncbi:MAG: Flp1 family type IVb pilin [Oscillospiraceae bacterium]
MMMQQMAMWMNVAKYKISKKFCDEKGEVNIVATVVLIGIAVMLAIIFKDEIAKLIGSLIEKITKSAGDAVLTPPKK